MNRAPTEDELQPNEPNDTLLYYASDGKTRLDVQLDRETVWLSQPQLSASMEILI